MKTTLKFYDDFKWDYTLCNDGSIKDLAEQVIELVK
jgi:hypothetical protein